MNPSTETAVNRDEEISSLSRKRSASTFRIQMLGGSGVGKTCFLAGLALLNEQSDGQSFVLPTDDATKAVFETLRETLSKGKWPAKTTIVDVLSFTVFRGTRRIDVRLSDFAGESFSDAMKRGNTSEAAMQIRSLVSDADMLLVLLDGAAVDRGTDFSGASLIQGVFERIGAEGRGDLDVAVVLTKSDLCVNVPIRTSDDLKQIVQDRVPDLARFLEEHRIQTAWIPVSVCGPDATDESGSPIYASLSPQGYETIFEQSFRRRNVSRNRRFKLIAAIAGLTLVLGVGGLLHRAHKEAEQAADIADPNIQIWTIQPVSPANEQRLRERYAARFEKLEKAIEASGNDESIQLVLKQANNFPETHERLVEPGLSKLRAKAAMRKEQLLHQAVINCQQLGTGDCVPLIGRYLSEFPDGPNADDLRKQLGNIKTERYLTARGHVKAVPVTSTEALKQKIAAITEFLRDYDQDLPEEQKAAITGARDIAAELITSRQYHCKLIRTSGMDTPRDHGVEIFIDRDRIANYDESGDVSEKNWNQEFTLTWQPGQQIQAKLVNYDTRDQDMAYFENNTPLAIVLLAGEQTPSRYATTDKWGGTDFTLTRPKFKIKFECRELPPEKLQIISDYLLPGDKW